MKQINSMGNSVVEVVNRAKGLVGKKMTFEIAPGSFDVVEFGSEVRQPLDGQPWDLVEGGVAELAGVDWSVVEH